MRRALAILIARISPARRRAVLPLMALMLAGAFAELVTIGALLPFLGVIADPDGSPALRFVQPLIDLVGASTRTGAVVLLTGLFAAAALAAASIRLVLFWAIQKFTLGVAYELDVALYGRILHQPYAFHVQRNSSEIIAGINKVQSVTNGIVLPAVNALVAMVISAFIIVGLIVVDPVVALASGAGFASIYLAVTAVTRTQLKRNSRIVARAQTQRVKSLQEGLGGIRDVLLDHAQSIFLEPFDRTEAQFRDARAKNAFFAQAPRFLIEGVGIVLIAIVAVAVSQRPGGLNAAIPVLGALALGAQRLLPLIQQIYSGWARAMGSRQELFDLVELLGHPVLAEKPTSHVESLSFDRAIALKEVSFSYFDDRAPAVHDLTLTIPKGARVGLAGKTGSGKSTLMDLILGLLEPTGGSILIDEVPLTEANRRAWQSNIAHVPQFIYLADSPIAENVAFGVRPEAVDMTRVRRAAEQARLSDVIAALPQQYDTRIGERGVQLSGGQRQRLGIARALYRDASVLVFDEATSALDTETEAAVMSAIDKLSDDLTIIIIAHRMTTLECCDFVIQLEGGRVKAVHDRRETLHPDTMTAMTKERAATGGAT